MRQSSSTNTARALAVLANLVPLALAGSGSGSVDNVVTAASLLAQGRQLVGDYYITSVSTGQTILYDRSASQSFYPTSGSGSPITFKAHGDGTNWMRMSAGNNKCVSAQWGPGGYDWAAVMYACAVDPLVNNNLEKSKQHWLFIPVDQASAQIGSNNPNGGDDGSDIGNGVGSGDNSFLSELKSVAGSKAVANAYVPAGSSSSSSSDDGVSFLNTASGKSVSKTTTTKKTTTKSSAKCPKSAAFVSRHPGYAKKHPACKSLIKCSKSSAWLKRHGSSKWYKKHPECKGLAKRDLEGDLFESLPSLEKRDVDHSDLAKRAVGSFYIIPFDHLYDMGTRALQAGSQNTGSGCTSTQLGSWDQSESQQWYLTPA
ncbi:hypothetical protein E5Q_02624 [Mixia osmundae IAM 14324]|uniref:Ricin B lectin domain-containing protein n=1 Tax=Mixia osmundae (strain CBS 9802 / IAM 14324 / JCM 22182 / KY 12970) TaxID=764103 RepID=G7DZF6_MIXOS|nr:hypothetical protein E5Q_02624 [Mixia osmundae IAM 14324]